MKEETELIRKVTKIDKNVMQAAGGVSFGTGGMRTKLKAAKLAVSKGINTVITNGKSPDIFYKILDGENAGTLFVGRD